MKIGRWSNDEDEILKNLFLKKEDKELQVILNRTIPSIIHRRKKLGLSKNKTEKFTISCKNCLLKFNVPFSRQKAQFCSRKCKGEYAKNNSGSIRQCLVCGETFYAKGNPKTKVCCSRECGDVYRKSGEYKKCDTCGKEIYKQKNTINRSKNFFCGINCANIFQIGERINLNCKICKKQFQVYPSDIKHSKIRGQRIQYCSLDCRDKDPERLKMLINLNHLQNRNKKRNKLEEKGISIIEDLNIEYVEQYLVNKKISVDIFIPKANLIIEWWGDYWHGHPNKIKNGNPDKRQSKRMSLDISQAKYLQTCGYKLITFWEYEVYKETKVVKEKIRILYDSILDRQVHNKS